MQNQNNGENTQRHLWEVWQRRDYEISYDRSKEGWLIIFLGKRHIRRNMASCLTQSFLAPPRPSSWSYHSQEQSSFHLRFEPSVLHHNDLLSYSLFLSQSWGTLVPTSPLNRVNILGDFKFFMGSLFHNLALQIFDFFDSHSFYLHTPFQDHNCQLYLACGI